VAYNPAVAGLRLSSGRFATSRTSFLTMGRRCGTRDHRLHPTITKKVEAPGIEPVAADLQSGPGTILVAPPYKDSTARLRWHASEPLSYRAMFAAEQPENDHSAVCGLKTMTAEPILAI
jgi:hypothetical protein